MRHRYGSQWYLVLATHKCSPQIAFFRSFKTAFGSAAWMAMSVSLNLDHSVAGPVFVGVVAFGHRHAVVS